MANTAELDKGLVDGLKAAKSKRAYFALVLKGSSDGALIVSKTKVPPAAIAEAKKKSGGSALVKGFCQYEEGTYVFETGKQAPSTAAQAVKIIAKRDAGLALKAEFRVSADPELLEDEGDSAAPASPPAAPPPDGAAVIKRFHAMTADIQNALGGPNNDRIKVLFATVRDALAKKDFAAATKNIDELVPLVKPAQAAAAPKDDGAAVIKRFHAMTADIQNALGGPNNDRIKVLFAAVRDALAKKDFAAATKNIDELAPLVKPAQAAAAPKDDGAAVIKRFHAMTADIQNALGGPNNDRVKTLFAAISDALAKKDFAAATKNIDELAPLVKPAQATAAPKDDGAALMKRLNAMTPEIKTALAGPNKASVQSLFVAANGQIKSNDFVQAGKSVDELEQLLKQTTTTAPPQPNGAELTKRLGAMTADIKTALAGPNKARVQSLYVAVSGQIKSNDFAAAVKSLDELQQLVKPVAGGNSSENGSPELAAALQGWTTARAAAAAQLAKLVGAFKTSSHPQAERGIGLLQAVINKQLTPRPTTAQQVAELVRYVDTDEIFTDVETPNPFGFTVNIREPLLKALGELKQHVA